MKKTSTTRNRRENRTVGSRVASLLLVMLLFFSFLSSIPSDLVQVFAETGTEQAEEDSVVREITELRKQAGKTFLMSDGTYTSVIYGAPVHALDEGGAWQEIDNRLTVDTRTGIARAGNTGVSFARSTPAVTVQREGHRLSWSVKGNGMTAGFATVTQAMREFFGTSRGVVNVADTGDYKSLSADEKRMSAAKAFSEVTYEKQADGYRVKYTAAPGRIKEDIILSSAKTTAFTVSFEENGLAARKDGARSVVFYDGEGNTVFTVRVPYMVDAAGEESTAITLSLTHGDEGYQLGIFPDYGWLTGEDRAYPVIIDPEYIYGDYSAENDIIDTMVHTGDSAASCSCGLNHNTHTMMRVGKKDGKQYRSYLKFNLESEYAISKLNSAKINLHLWSGTSTGGPFSIYRVTSPWDPDTLTYAAQPGATVVQSNVPYVTKSDGSKTVTFDVTSAVESMLAGACRDYGFMVRYTNTATNDSNSFYTVDYSTVSYRPQIVLNYNEHIVADGSTLRVNNAGNHEFLLANGSTLSTGEYYSIDNYSSAIDNGSQWTFYRLDSYHGYCSIRSCDGKALKDTGSSVTLVELSSGIQNNLGSMPINCQWNLFRIGEQAVIKNRATGRYLRISGSTVTASTTNTGSAGRWYVGYTPCYNIWVGDLVAEPGETVPYSSLQIALNYGQSLPSLATDVSLYTSSVSPAGAATFGDVGLTVNANFTGGEILVTLGRKDTLAIATFRVLVSQFPDTYFIKNVATDLCLDRYSASTSYCYQYGFDNEDYQRWIFELQSDGYYMIKSVGSGRYLQIYNNSTGSGEAAILAYKDVTAAGQKFSIEKNSNDTYTIYPKTGEANNYILASQSTGSSFVGQGSQTSNDNRDEWRIIPNIYGNQPFRQLNEDDYDTINCHSYAMMLDSMIYGLTPGAAAYVKNSVEKNNDLIYDAYSEDTAIVANIAKEDFEQWLERAGYTEGETYYYEENFVGNGENSPLNENQYRVILRIGLQNVYYTDLFGNRHIVEDENEGEMYGKYDYHFWYQTYDGRWANKHGAEEDSAPELLGYGLAPHMENTGGWRITDTFDDFYNSEIFSYVITINEQ